MSFAGDIGKFKKHTEEAATKIFRAASIEVLSRVILRSPVDTGRLRGNWIATINRPSSKTTEVSGASPALAKASSVVRRARLGDSIFLVNNLPYAEPIENGSSDQAPRGMVKITVAEFEQTVKKHTKK